VTPQQLLTLRTLILECQQIIEANRYSAGQADSTAYRDNHLAEANRWTKYRDTVNLAIQELEAADAAESAARDNL